MTAFLTFYTRSNFEEAEPQPEMTLCLGAIIVEDVPATSCSGACGVVVCAFVLPVHQMGFGLVLVYVGLRGVSEGATN